MAKKTSKEDVKNQEKINAEKKRELSFEEELIALLRKRRGISGDILSDQHDIANVIRDQAKQIQFEVEQRKLIMSLTSRITKIAQESYTISKSELGLTKTNVNIAKKQEELDKSIVLLEQQKAKYLKKGGRLNVDIADSINMQVKAAQQLKRDMRDIADTSKDISNEVGVKTFGGMSEISKKIPGLSKFSGPFEEASEAARATVATNVEMLKTGKGLTKEKVKEFGLEKKLQGWNKKKGKFETLAGTAAAKKAKAMGLMPKALGGLTAGFKALGPMITKALGPIGLIIEGIKAFIQIDKAAGDMAKSMGVSYLEGAKVVANAADAAALSGDLLVSSKDVVKAQMTLNKLYGTAVEFTGEFAAEFASVQERTGLSTEAMARFGSMALENGTSIKDQLRDINSTVMALNAEEGIMMNAKEIQEDIGKMSSLQLINAKKNLGVMAEQVFQSKLLGLTTAQTAKIGSSLLDFESSIQAEMEAELLLGRNLNLEKARQYALENDIAGLAKELGKQGITSAKFGDMNAIKQKAVAAAFGMQAEEMGDMLIKQDKLNVLKKAGFESMSEAQAYFNEQVEAGLTKEEVMIKMKKKGLDDTTTAQMASTSQADRLAAVMDKITDLFIQLVDPLLPLVDAIMMILEPIFAILSPIFKLIGDLVGLIMKTLNPSIAALKVLFNGITEQVENIKDVFNGVADVFTGLMTADFGMVADGIEKITTGLVNYMIWPFQTLVDMAFAFMNSVIKGMNKIPGISWELLDIPSVKEWVGLKEGGIVTQPTQALIGEAGPEVVIPLSKFSGKDGINSEIVDRMDKLIALIEKGGDVYMDGNKVGKSLALVTSDMG